MKLKLLTLSAICFYLLFACNPQTNTSSLQVQVKNTGFSDLNDITVAIPISKELVGKFGLKNTSVEAVIENESIPVQLMVTKDTLEDKLFVNLDIPTGNEVSLAIRAETKTDSIKTVKRTHAEIWHKTGGRFENGVYIGGGDFKPFTSLRVPDEYTDNSLFIKYEGTGWESDKVGYRLYLDWRNAIDIFGKKISAIVLPGVGFDGYESYHKMADWGADVLKVGSSLGIGSLGFWDGDQAKRVAETDSVICTIAEDGNIYSEINIDYFGWKIHDISIDLKTSLSITAGSRATKYSVLLSDYLPNMCTGIVKHDNGELIKGDHSEGWNYLATWGAQTLFDDNLGMAILYSQASPTEINEDEFSHVVLLSPVNNTVEYYFLAAWEHDPDGIGTKQEFIEYLDNQVELLNNPVDIKIAMD